MFREFVECCEGDLMHVNDELFGLFISKIRGVEESLEVLCFIL